MKRMLGRLKAQNPSGGEVYRENVELVGVEPTSKHGIKALSTCLVFP